MTELFKTPGWSLQREEINLLFFSREEVKMSVSYNKISKNCLSTGSFYLFKKAIFSLKRPLLSIIQKTLFSKQIQFNKISNLDSGRSFKLSSLFPGDSAFYDFFVILSPDEF